MNFFWFFNNVLGIFGQVFLLIIGGLIFGSFASLISYRLAKKQPIVFARSKCPNCNKNLKIFNLIPLFSWLFQKGKCGNCHVKISIRYPLIELVFVMIFLSVFFALNRQLDFQMTLILLIASTLVVMCIIDLEHYFIPDSTQYFLTILATIFLLNAGGESLVLANVKSAFLYLAFGLAMFCFFYFVAQIEAIGIDDLKFFFVAGFLLGVSNFLSFIFFDGLLGLLFGCVWQKITKETIFPFAPAICLSTFLCLLFGKKINPIEILSSLIF
jgi:prepilin signal peptidase PulO-like enzyme (type II secretory pathway)